MENDTIKVHYFPLNGRVMVIRCMLDVAKVKYENIIHTFEEWGKMEKPSNVFEYGFLPVVEINGKSFSQRIAVTSYLGKKLGFMGSNAEEEYEILNYLSSFDDVAPELGGALFIQDKDAQQKRLKELADSYLSWILPIYERKFTSRTGKYLVGDKLSAADMIIAYLFWFLRSQKEAWVPSMEKLTPTLSVWAEALLTNELKDNYDGNFIKNTFL